MAFRNKELVDKGFTNIKTNVRTLDLMVSRGGSSVEDFFWVSNTISLFSSITVSRAFIDLSLPTNNGAIIFGKMTISLRGKIGNDLLVKVISFRSLRHLQLIFNINDNYFLNFKFKIN